MAEYPCPYCDTIPTSSPGQTLHVKAKHPELYISFMAKKKGLPASAISSNTKGPGEAVPAFSKDLFVPKPLPLPEDHGVDREFAMEVAVVHIQACYPCSFLSLKNEVLTQVPGVTPANVGGVLCVALGEAIFRKLIVVSGNSEGLYWTLPGCD